MYSKGPMGNLTEIWELLTSVAQTGTKFFVHEEAEYTVRGSCKDQAPNQNPA